MHGQLSKETATFLVKLSKIFETSIPLEKFAVVEPDRVMMAEFIPNPSFPDYGYILELDNFPQSFIQHENTIALEDSRLMFNGINISGMTHIDKGSVRHIKFKDTDRTLDSFRRTEGKTNVIINGKLFKSLLTPKMNGMDDYLYYYRDSEVSVLARGDCGLIRYALEVGEPGEELFCVYPLGYLRKSATLFPNYDICLSFDNEYPMSVIWQDEDKNQCMIVVAPRIEERYMKDENGKEVVDKSRQKLLKSLLKVKEEENGTEIQKV